MRRISHEFCQCFFKKKFFGFSFFILALEFLLRGRRGKPNNKVSDCTRARAQSSRPSSSTSFYATSAAVRLEASLLELDALLSGEGEGEQATVRARLEKGNYFCKLFVELKTFSFLTGCKKQRSWCAHR